MDRFAIRNSIFNAVFRSGEGAKSDFPTAEREGNVTLRSPGRKKISDYLAVNYLYGRKKK